MKTSPTKEAPPTEEAQKDSTPAVNGHAEEVDEKEADTEVRVRRRGRYTDVTTEGGGRPTRDTPSVELFTGSKRPVIVHKVMSLIFSSYDTSSGFLCGPVADGLRPGTGLRTRVW